MSSKAVQFILVKRPKCPISGVVHKVRCSLYNESYHGESIRSLDIKSGEQIGASPFSVQTYQ